MDTPQEALTPPSTETEGPQQATITKLVYGGDGLARLPSGEVVMAPFTAPGDEIIATPRSQGTPSTVPAGKKKRALKDIRIVTPSPQRVEAACSIFGTCGGCQWQHLSYADQKKWKQSIVEESLTRIGKLSDIRVNETIGAESAAGTSPWHYRNKVQWFVQNSPQSTKIGYYRQKSHEILPFEHCWIIPEAWNDLAHWLEKHLPHQSGIEIIQVRTNGAGQLLLTFAGQQIAETINSDWFEILQQAFPSLIGVALEQEFDDPLIWGEGFLTETLTCPTGDLKFQVSASSFFQTNPLATQQLLDFMESCLPETMDSLLDLYAGVGLFSIWAAKRSKRVLAIESSPTAVADAEANIEQNHCPNVAIEPGDVRKVLKALTQEEQQHQVAIVDPPRSGCTPDVIEWLATNITEQIVYISCDPTTLARDLKLFSEQGWRVETVQPFDMFPQTYHIETLVSIKKAV